MKIRWIDTSCFEIETDQGKRIVTDPYIDECSSSPVSSDDIGAMDYILISHTHFDHISQLDKYFDLYRPKILTGPLNGISLLRNLDLSGQCLYGMENGETLDFGDTRFLRLSGKHSIPGRKSRHLVRESDVIGEFKETFSLPDKYLSLMSEGFYEFSNYLIETADNTRLLLWGGGVTHEQAEKARGLHPDIILMQIPSNPPSMIAEFVRTCGASYVIPHHHDTYYGSRDVAAMISGIAEEISSLSPWVKTIDPVPGHWYNFSKQLQEG
ncbi:MAG: MBL fold metallo-hydrolase [Oscillospiraceae bacterium]|nr:MBL fold metallo-hydrolase [Oscillospiraceae bacterium]